MTREATAALLYWSGLSVVAAGCVAQFGAGAGAIAFGAGVMIFVVLNRA